MLGTKSKTLGKGYNEKLVLIPTPALKHPEAAVGLGFFGFFFLFFFRDRKTCALLLHRLMVPVSNVQNSTLFYTCLVSL